MYIIYRVDNDDGEIIETSIGVINGDERAAIEWISKNNIEIEKVVDGVPFPRIRQRYIKELKLVE